MKVCLPEQPAKETVGLDGSGVEELVVGNIAVCMLGIAKEVNRSVTDDAGSNPPEQQRFHAFDGGAESGENDNVDAELENRPHLHFTNDRSADFFPFRALHAPAQTGVVCGYAHAGTQKATAAVLEVAKYIHESHEIARL